MTIKIDPAVCLGARACAKCSDITQDERLPSAAHLNPYSPQADEESVISAAASCPKAAIIVVGDRW